MLKHVKTFNNILKAITKPNPKRYPDPSMHEFQWNRNLTSLHTCLIFYFSTIFFAIQLGFSWKFKVVFSCTYFSLLTCFTILCRSHLPLFNGICVSVSLIYAFNAPDIIPDVPYLHTGFILLIVTCTIIRSGNTRLTLFAGTVHLFIYLAKFREKMVFLMQNEDPEIFAEKFVKSTTFIFTLIFLGEIAMVKTLEKRTLELLKVRGALENALEQQKTFIFSFSHELRNPLNSLLGNLQLVLADDGLSRNLKEMVNIAKVCGELLLHNINNVLDTGKHEIGKLEVNPVPTSLSEMFPRTWSIYSESLKHKKLKGELKIDKQIPEMVKIDSHKLNQVLLNLVGNSIKFTEKGAVTVVVKWLKNIREVNEKCFEPIPYDDIGEGLFEKEENVSIMNTSWFSESHTMENGIHKDSNQQESKGILKIVVKDTGCGMKKEALEKLFNKFSQVSENASQRQIGTGLGLFITKEICLAMGGDIRAFSKVGNGSTFIVCIPTASIPEKNIQRADSESIFSELSRKHIKALVADDSPFNVNLIGNYFSQFGASVVGAAYNGYDALMKYKECREVGQLDVVTLDIDMPILDGRDACDKIRKYERERKLEPVLIILISGNYDKEQIDGYLDPARGRRADCFLRKPVSYSEFNRAVYNLLHGRGS